MKIFMLNPMFVPDFCRSARWAAKSRGRVQRHPDWMLIASAVLKQSGHEVTFLDGAAMNTPPEAVSRMLKEVKPELVVIHTTTPSIYNDISYAGIAKEACNGETVLIGPHVTCLAEDTFRHASKSVDIIARGEYDYTLRDIAAGMPRKDISGISYLQGEGIVNNPARPYLDVNALPFPAWEFIDPRLYRDAGKRFPFLTLLSGRGCFGQCTFCRDTALMYGHKVRMRDPQLVVDEIEYDYHLFPYLREIMFETDTFTASADHVRGICEEILRRGLKITWSCNVRVDVQRELLPLMKKAGCRMLMVGFEFGTQCALDAVKKQVTLEQSKMFAETAHRLGFTIHGCFMVGAPQETEESARKTIDFACSLPLDTVQFSGICVYPGTQLYEWAKVNRFLIAKDWTEWVDRNYEQVTLLSYPQLPKEKIDTLIDLGLRRFYLRPVQIMSMVLSVRSWDDIRRKLFGLKGFWDYFFAGKRRDER
jgi:radical SAM superfamily enzyme YgiQ (UPF0313 family)